MGAVASVQAPLSHGLRLGADGGHLEHLRARRLQRAAPPSPGIAGIEAIPVRRRDVRATLQFGARLEHPLPLGLVPDYVVRCRSSFGNQT